MPEYRVLQMKLGKQQLHIYRETSDRLAEREVMSQYLISDVYEMAEGDIKRGGLNNKRCVPDT